MNAMRPILLIEDNPMDVDLTLRAFSKRRLANPVEVARDGEEAMRRVDAWEGGEPPPLLILLDLKLPKVDGMDVLGRIKAHPRLRSVPVVVLTTSTEEVDMRTAYQLGANSYIVKPVSFDNFMEVATQIELYWGVLNHALENP
ncbi:MAG TPA: response regulator [Thiobacillaceae bacterium]|nr:response regulator [Thiobacillaceae bacterium]HNA81835.1 response regulator [Thiobacillaceae bacterium]HNF89223.1 response regulator [Thiobacillaceae bacterium]HNH89535.1 response regulator [Thiobacillaceae bacterium]HNI08198.1 response regulator [Thiobacillaceae bacterium]